MKQIVYLFLIFINIIFACKSLDNVSDTKIINGSEVSEDDPNYEAVVQLWIYNENNKHIGYCTGTFLNDTTLITAAHCLGDFTKDAIGVKANGTTIRSLNIFVYKIFQQYAAENKKLEELYRQAYEEDKTCKNISYPNPTNLDLYNKIQSLEQILSSKSDEVYAYDVAIVVFPQGTGNSIVKSKKFYEIYDNQNVNIVGNKIKLIGYGYNKFTPNSTKIKKVPNSCLQEYDYEPSGAGIKRMGYNTIAHLDLDKNEVLITHDLKDKNKSSTLWGDSGGPGLICENNECNKIIGVASRGTTSYYAKRSLYTYTGGDIAKNLFKTAIQCSDGPCAQNFKGSGIPMNTTHTNYDKNIYIAISQKIQNDTYEILVSAKPEIKTIKLCLADKNTCLNNPNNATFKNTEFFTTHNNRSIFKVINGITIINNMNITLLGYDQNQNIISAKSIKINN